MPLHILTRAVTEQLQSVKLPVEANAKLDSPGSDGFSPLQTTIANKRFAIAEHLISQGAQTELIGEAVQAPIYLAAAHNDVPNSLWKSLDDIDKRCEHGNTYLNVAALNQKAASAENLLKWGCDVNSKTLKANALSI